MAKQQAVTKTKQAPVAESKNPKKDPARRSEPQPSNRGRGEAETGARDDTYNLISVLYHSLQGADTVSKYLRDAQGSQNEEVRDYLERVRDTYAELAQEGKSLLADHLSGEGFDEDEEDEESEEDEE